MTRERHLLGHLIFQTNEGDVAVASKQIYNSYSLFFSLFLLQTLRPSQDFAAVDKLCFYLFTFCWANIEI